MAAPEGLSTPPLVSDSPLELADLSLGGLVALLKLCRFGLPSLTSLAVGSVPLPNGAATDQEGRRDQGVEQVAVVGNDHAHSAKPAQCADVQGGRRAIEVETETTARDGLRQLQGYQKPVYMAGADEKATQAALEATKGTTVVVMNVKGRIVKPSSRKKRR